MKASSKHPEPIEQRISPLQRYLPLMAMGWVFVFWCLFFTSTLPNASNAERTVDRIDVIGLLPEIYTSLFEQSPDSDSSSSWSNLTQRIDLLVVAVSTVLTALCAGRLILRSLSLLKTFDTPTGGALAGGLGMAAVSLWTLACGLAGWLSQPLFLFAMAIVILAEVFLCWRSRHKQEQNDGEIPDSVACPKWLKYSCLAICLPFLCCMLLGSMLPPTDFDVKEYHLGGPKEYFLTGSIHFLSHDIYTSFPFLTEMLSLTAMVLRGDWERGAYAGQAVLMAFAPLTALGVYCVAREISGTIAGWLGAFAYLTIPWTYRISIIAYTEGALCCYVVLTLLAFLIWKKRLNNSEPNASLKWRELLVVGLLAGNAVSTKYPGMVLVAIPFAVAVLLSTFRLPERRSSLILMNLVTYGVGVLITFGPWMLKNLIETGNPVYPLLYGVFGGIDWSEAQHQQWQAAHPAKLFSPGWHDVIGIFYYNDWQSPLLFGLSPLAFLQRRRKPLIGVTIYAFILFAVWYLFTHRIDRFWVPMNSVMAVLAGVGMSAALHLSPTKSVKQLSKSQKPRAKRTTEPVDDEIGRTPLRWMVLTLVLLATIYNFGFIVTPLCGYNAYLIDETKAREQTKTQSVAIVDSLNLPPDAKVLFVGEAELFDAHFPYAYNTVFDKNLLEEWSSTQTGPDEWELLPADQIRKKLESKGIQYVFVNWNEVLRYRVTYGFTDFISPNRMQQLVDLDVLIPIPLPKSISYRPWDSVDQSWKEEIKRWSPELRKSRRGQELMVQYQCFRVVAPSSGNE